MTTQELAAIAQEAFAAYFDLLGGTPSVDRLLDGGKGMTLSQATAFAGRYTVVVPTVHDGDSDLDVTVYRDAAGSLSLGIRGTLPGRDLTITDMQIAFQGAAYDQIVALWNWWKKASTPTGEVAQFVLSSRTTVSAFPPTNDTPGAVYLYSSTLSTGPDGTSLTTHHYLEPAAPVPATGELVPLLAADPDHKIDVTGHSLGAHLALAFNSLFGPSVGQVVGFDTPGFIDSAVNRQFFAALGGAVPTSANSSNFVSVFADEANVGSKPFNAIAGVHSRPGIAVDIAIENQWLSDEPNPESALNHSMKVLADSLAVFDLLSTLDPALTTTNYKTLLAGATQGTAAGYERLLDGIEALLNINQARLPVGNGQREALYQALYGVQSKSVFGDIAGKVRIDPSSTDLGAKARNDFSALASLITLSPVVLTATSPANRTVLDGVLQVAWGQTYLDWQADQTMPLADRDAGKLTFTDEWIADRARLIDAIVVKNAKNESDAALVSGPNVPRNTAMRDIASGRTILSGAINPDQRAQIVFGDSGANTLDGYGKPDHLYGGAGADTLSGQGGADHLEGNADNDTLNGDAGNDTLLGSTGDDFLEGGADDDRLLGGAGNDTYFFASTGWGADTLEDSDGQGSLRVPGYEAGLPQGNRQANGRYYSADETVIYTLQQITSTREDLHIAFAGRADTLTIRNWQPGQLRITLDGAIVPINPNWVDAGDDQPDADDRLTAFHDPDGDGPLDGGYVRDVKLSGGGGADTVLGYVGNDILEGGVGSDVVLGEASVIVVTQPPAGDPGDDRIFGDAEVDLDLAIVQGNVQTASGLKGDWLGGEDGDDAIVGSTGNDVLMGGRGADLLIAGAGDDDLNGDDDYAPGTAGPWSVGAMPGNEFDRVYTPVLSYNRDDDRGTGDILYGGAGNDHLLGMAGDDVLYGESDDDTAAGGDDDDTVLGGAGDDRLSGDHGQSTSSSGRIIVQGDDYLDGGDGADFAQGEGGDDALFGGSGNDELWGDAKTYTDAGLNGADYLDGEDGDDDLVGQGGADTLFGGAGNDSLFGDADNVDAAFQAGDLLDGEDGDDYLRGYGGDDELLGGSGADQLLGDAGDDRLSGHAAADVISGGDGNDVLTGGAGLDVLLGDAGDDSYVFALGDGANGVDIEAINDRQGRNTVVFSDAYTTGLAVQDDGAGNLIIDYSSGDRLAVLGGVTGSVAGYQFATGTTYTASELVGRFSSGSVMAVDDQGRPVTFGGVADDSITASIAGAMLSGGLGDDTLSGSGGRNTYLYSPGDGVDRIVDTSAKTDWQGQPAPNRLVFGAGIAPTDVILSHADGDLMLSIGSVLGASRVVIAGFNAADALGTPAIDLFEFSDGTVLSHAQLLARGFDLAGSADSDLLQGSSVDDRFDGGAGDDTLRGGLGSDVYSFGTGSGLDLVDDGDGTSGAVDTLRVGGTLTPTDLQLVRRGNDLLVNLRGSADRATVVNQFAGAGVEQLTFGDGTTWDAAAIAANVTNELTEGADVFTGTAGSDLVDAKGGNDLVDALAGPDVVEGGAGDDTLNGGDGNDALHGGAGNDSLIGGQGADTYRFGPGGAADVIDDQGMDGAIDVLRLDPGITPQGVTLSGAAQITLSVAGTGDSIRFAGPDAAGAGKIERIEFADGTVWTEAQWAQRLLDGATTSGSDYIVGFASTGDTILGLDGWDTLSGLGGDDLLDGGSGTDSLDGGAGSDELVDGEQMLGGAGNDTYRLRSWYSPFDSNVVVSEATGTAGDVDVLMLPPDVTPGQLVATPEGALTFDDLRLEVALTGNGVTLSSYFASQDNNYKVEQIRFADGTVWSVADVIAKVAQTQMTAGNDLVAGSRFDDVLDGQVGDDTVVGTFGNDQVSGGAGNDTIYGDTANEALALIGDGNDGLDGGTGNDLLYGGGGNDTYAFGRGRGSDTTVDVGGTDRILLEPGVLPDDVTLFRDGTRLVLAIDQGPTQMAVSQQFSGGNQSIESIQFADGTVWDAAAILARAVSGTPNAMTGTSGDDTFIVDDRGDSIIEGTNQGIDTVLSAVDYSLGANLENLTLTGYLNAFGNGNALNNVIRGNAGSNTFNQSAFDASGADTLIGGAGDDVYYLNGPISTFFGNANSDDTVVEAVGEGIDTVVTSTLGYTLPANVENLFSTYTGVPVSLGGNGLSNLLEAARNGQGASFAGGPGADTMRGTGGDDYYEVDDPGDVVEERGFTTRGVDTSHDSVFASISYTLGNGLESLSLRGSAAITGMGNERSNLLEGVHNPAANVLFGGAGDDTYRLGIGDSAVELAAEGNDSAVLYGWGAGTYSLAAFANVENLSLEEGLGAANLVGDAQRNVLIGDRQNNEINGGGGNDTLQDSDTRTNDIDVLIGGDGDDTLSSLGGDDLLDGGRGNDALSGQGTVTVAFGRGYGADVWSTYGENMGRKIVLDGTLQLTDLNVSRANFDLILSFGQGDVLSVPGFFTNAATTDHVRLFGELVFADGTRLDTRTLVARLVSGNSNEASEGADVLFGTGGTDAVRGLGGDDQLFTIGGNDDLTGGTGRDLLFGGSGDDVYRFARGDGYDTITEVGGVDTVLLGADIAAADVTVRRNGTILVLQVGASDEVDVDGFFRSIDSEIESVTFADGTVWDNATLRSMTDQLNGTSGADVLNGNGASERIYGLAGNDQLNGFGGDDLLDGGTGNDTMAGGQGNDTYVVDSASDVVTESSGQGTDSVQSSVTLGLASNVENLLLTGTAPINGTGNTLANTITGNSAANTLSGGAGADTMIGGAGNDSYTVDNAADAVTELVDEGVDTVTSSVTHTLAANVENLTLTGSSGLRATGNTLDNLLTGNSGANTLTGDAGNDRLDGGSGTDTMIGGSGDDTYVVNTSADVVTELAGEGVDSIESSVTLTLGAGNTVENLRLLGSGRINATGNGLANVLTGNTGNNTLTGNAGDDTLDGGAGTDTMRGGAGNDTYVVERSADVTTENANEGIDTVVSSVTRTLGSNLENLTLSGAGAINGTGNTLANVLIGNGAANTLAGLAGDDTYDGGAGNDALTDNATTSSDVYRWGIGSGTDTVTDSGGGGDRVELGAGITAEQLVFSHVGNNLELTVAGASDKLVVANWYLSSANRIETFRLNDGSTVSPSAIPLAIAAREVAAADGTDAELAFGRQRVTPGLRGEPPPMAAPARVRNPLPWKPWVRLEPSLSEPAWASTDASAPAALMAAQAQGLVASMAAFGAAAEAAIDNPRQTIMPVHRIEPTWVSPALM